MKKNLYTHGLSLGVLHASNRKKHCLLFVFVLLSCISSFAQSTPIIPDCGKPTSSLGSTYPGVGIQFGFLSQTNLSNANDGDPNTYASDNSFGVLLGFVYYNHTMGFNVTSDSRNSSVNVILGNGGGLSVNLTSGLYKIDFLNQGTIVDGTPWRSFPAFGLLGIVDYSKIVVNATSSQPFDQVIVRMGQAGISVSVFSEIFRLYEVQRTSNPPTVVGSTIYSTYGTPAQLTASGYGSPFVWLRSTTATYDVYDGNGNKTGTKTDTVALPTTQGGYIASTSAASTDPTTGLSTSNPFNTGNLQKDTILFVSSVLASCTSDTSAPGRINVKLTSTVPYITASINPANTAVVLNWSIANEYKARNLTLQRRIAGSSGTWTTISTIASKAPADPSTSGRYTNTGTTPTTYTYSDASVDRSKTYEYQVIVNDNSQNGIPSNIAVQPYSLPVMYLQPLTATAVGSANVLNWTTGAESNNKGFHILRSADSKTWSEIGFVASSALNGTGNGAPYTFTDKAPLAGINYYQLQQEDLDGKTKTSNTAQVTNMVAQGSIKLYPNPVASDLKVENAPVGAYYRVLDLAGKVLLSGVLDGNPATVQAGSLASGMYIVELSDGHGTKYGSYKILKK